MLISKIISPKKGCGAPSLLLFCKEVIANVPGISRDIIFSSSETSLS
jgi:hypothetical protein